MYQGFETSPTSHSLSHNPLRGHAARVRGRIVSHRRMGIVHHGHSWEGSVWYSVVSKLAGLLFAPPSIHGQKSVLQGRLGSSGTPFSRDQPYCQSDRGRLLSYARCVLPVCVPQYGHIQIKGRHPRAPRAKFEFLPGPWASMTL